jgi:hypothetical protein
MVAYTIQSSPQPERQGSRALWIIKCAGPDYGLVNMQPLEIRLRFEADLALLSVIWAILPQILRNVNGTVRNLAA